MATADAKAIRAKIPTVTLHSGDKLPQFGLGTWKSKPSEVYEAVKWALDAGYNHIDCALVYENEHEVGRALKEKLGTVIERKDLFITSKLWNTHREPHLIRPALMKTLTDLGLTYLDLYLIHWPFDFAPGDVLFPRTPDGKDHVWGKTDYVDVWRELEKFVDEGLVKNIGISNFNHTQIDRILNVARIKPAALQVECHPFLAQEKLSNYCKEKGIAFQSYAPLGAPDRTWGKPDDPVLLQHPVVLALAEKHKKTPGQILIRYHIDRSFVVIPKSVNQARINENIQIFDFQLSEEEVKSLSALDKGFRYYGSVLPSDRDHPHFGFKGEF